MNAVCARIGGLSTHALLVLENEAKDRLSLIFRDVLGLIVSAKGLFLLLRPLAFSQRFYGIAMLL